MQSLFGITLTAFSYRPDITAVINKWFSGWSLTTVNVIFVLAALVIGVGGPVLLRLAFRLADAIRLSPQFNPQT